MPTAARGPPRRCGTAGATTRRASPTAARGPPRRCGTAGATTRRASPTAARGPPRRCGTAGATTRRASPTAARGPPRRCGTAGATTRRASPTAARGWPLLLWAVLACGYAPVRGKPAQGLRVGPVKNGTAQAEAGGIFAAEFRRELAGRGGLDPDGSSARELSAELVALGNHACGVDAGGGGA